MHFRDPGTPLTEDQLLMRKRVLHQAEAEPETFAMAAYQGRNASCGTTRCIAGWAVYLTRGYWYKRGACEDLEDKKQLAVDVLGLTQEEYGNDVLDREGPYELFYVDDDEGLARLRALAEG